MPSKKELKQTINFIFSREQRQGGFSFAEFMPSTIEDTYFATKALEVIKLFLKKDIPVKQESIEFIKNLTSQINTIDLKSYYQLSWLLEYYNFKFEKQIKSTQTKVKDIEQFYYLISLTKDPGKNNKKILKKEINDLQYIQDIAYLLLSKRKLGLKIDKNLYTSRIQEIQNLDGGFGFYKGSTTFLENTYWAIKALNSIGKKPLDTKTCIDFIKRCRVRNGGYGRNSSTVPSLETTFYALESLRLLN